MLPGYNTNMTPLFNNIYLEASGPMPLAYFFCSASLKKAFTFGQNAGSRSDAL
jgi:hypothetical protein